MSDYRWLTELSRIFLERDYLVDGQTVDQRVDEICNTAEKLLNKPGFAAKFKENFQKGWYSLSTPIWTNFGNERGMPISCFGSSISDSMQSIAYTWAEVAMMTKYGGGTSATFGNLRPRGASIRNNGESSGAVHFMQAFENLIQIVSQGSCYIEGTEVLTNNGFKDFREVLATDKLAQLDEFNNVSFTEKYEMVVNDFEGNLICLSGKKTENSVSIKVTPNHRMVICRRKMQDRERYWPSNTEIVEAQDLNLHRDNRIPLAGWAGKGDGLSNFDRLRIAYQADGRKDDANRKIRFHFAKERKVQRLEKILNDIGIKYEKKTNPDKTISINFEYEESVKKKTFSEWVRIEEINGIWAQEFIEELSCWDGSVSHGGCITYSSIDKTNIDLVQAIAALADLKTRVRIRPAYGNRRDLHCINISENSYRGGESINKTEEYYKGKVYCAIVPEGRLLVRYQDRVMVCGNTRRGNFAAYLPIDHADIMEFLQIRTEGFAIQDLSYGVCVPDYWMEEMINGDADKRKVWAKVLEMRANFGYPYITFIDNANNNTADCYKENNLKITHSNLCVSGDQIVISDRGMISAKELYEQGGALKLFDNKKVVNASAMQLVEKNADVFKINLSNGMSHTITSYHKVLTSEYNNHHKEVSVVKECKDLKVGDRVAIQTNKGLFGNKDMQEEAFLLGLYQADGTQHEDIIMLDIWENYFDLIDEVENKFSNIHTKYGCDSYEIAMPNGMSYSRGRKAAVFHDCVVSNGTVAKKRLAAKTLKKALNFQKGIVPKWIFESNEETIWQYIRGLLYADGTVFKASSAGEPISISLANINLDFLKQLQLLYANLGLQSSIRILCEAGKQLLPDGKGGHKYFDVKDCWRLIVGNKNDALEIEKNTGFLSRKGIEIDSREYRNNTKKYYKIESIEYVGKEDVYCCTVESEENLWVCNGVITHNCNEIYLPDNEDESFVCDLSSMNILYYDEWKDTDAVELLVYLLDAVMTEFIEKAKNIKFMERAVKFAERHRALGVGWLGWHSYLQSKMIPWESMEAKFHNTQIAKNIKEAAYKASAKLAEEYGEPEVCKGYDRRNTTLLAIAPTKSSSFILGQVSEGIEPHRANYYIKDLQKGKFTIKNAELEKLLKAKGHDTEEVWKSILMNGGSVQHLECLTEEEKNVFKTFAEISPKEIMIQAAQRQKYIDQGQSLNLMIHPSVPTKDVNSLIIEGWKMGIKGLYYQISVNAAQKFARSILTCTSCES